MPSNPGKLAVSTPAEPLNNDGQESRAKRSSGKEAQEDAELASTILHSYLAEHGVSYKKLAKLLETDGENERTLSNKVKRGRFSFAFVVRVMRALGEESVDIVPRGQRRKSRGLLDL